MSRIVFLGYCSNSFSQINNVSFLYENDGNKMLVDCGSTIPYNLHSVVESLSEINYCYISHSHFDHFLGLPYFLIGRNLDIMAKLKKNSNFAVTDLNIIIEKKLQPVIEELLRTCHPDVKQLKYNINFIDLNDTTIVNTSNFKIVVRKMNHTVDTYGFYLLEQDKKILSYTSDTIFDENIIDFLSGSKYLIIEGMVPGSEENFSKNAKHATFEKAIEVINRITADISFVVHLQPRYLDSIIQIESYIRKHSNCITGFPKVGEWYVLHL